MNGRATRKLSQLIQQIIFKICPEITGSFCYNPIPRSFVPRLCWGVSHSEEGMHKPSLRRGGRCHSPACNYNRGPDLSMEVLPQLQIVKYCRNDGRRGILFMRKTFDIQADLMLTPLASQRACRKREFWKDCKDLL